MELKIELIINRKLYERKIISNDVFQKINDLLLSKIAHI